MGDEFRISNNNPVINVMDARAAALEAKFAGNLTSSYAFQQNTAPTYAVNADVITTDGDTNDEKTTWDKVKPYVPAIASALVAGGSYAIANHYQGLADHRGDWEDRFNRSGNTKQADTFGDFADHYNKRATQFRTAGGVAAGFSIYFALDAKGK